MRCSDSPIAHTLEIAQIRLFRLVSAPERPLFPAISIVLPVSDILTSF